MLKIGEFSVLSQISIHMLRHYNDIGLLIPEHVSDIPLYNVALKKFPAHNGVNVGNENNPFNKGV